MLKGVTATVTGGNKLLLVSHCEGRKFILIEKVVGGQRVKASAWYLAVGGGGLEVARVRAKASNNRKRAASYGIHSTV